MRTQDISSNQKSTLSGLHADMDERLLPMKDGLKVSIDKAKMFEYNYPNYNLCDIIVNKLTLDAEKYNPAICGNEVVGYGECSLDGSTYPEADWEHMPGNLFQVVINQVGKASQTVTTGLNGIALRSTKSDNKRATSPHFFTFNKQSRVFVKAGQLFVKAKFDFFQDDKKVAHYETLSLGITRDYSEMIAKKGEIALIGQKLVSARALTPAQCDFLVAKQKQLKATGESILFGELAVKYHFCTESDVEESLKVFQK